MIPHYFNKDASWPQQFLFAQVLLAVFLPLFSLPPFHIGMWFQSEPVNVALYAMTGLLAFTLVHPAFHARALKAVKHPAVWAAGALFAWSLVVAPFAEYPMKSIQGSPETGQGGLWTLALFLWSVAVLLVIDRPMRRVVLLGVMLFVTLVIFGLQNFQDDPNWFAVKWPDFQAFIGLFCFIILTAQFGHLGWKAWLGAYLFGAILVYISDSRAAYICYFFLLPVIGGFLALVLHSRYKLFAMLRPYIDMLAAAILVFGVVLYVLISLPSEHYYDQTIEEPMLQQKERYDFYYHSLGTRMLFNKVALHAIADNPAYLVTGAGWGHYATSLFRYTFIDEVSSVALFDEYGQDAANWFMVKGTAFHSHNSYMETLHSTGLVGLFLFLMFFTKVMPKITNIQRALLAGGWIATATLFSFWFLLVLVTTYFAIAVAFSVSLDEKTDEAPAPSAKPKLQSAVMLVLALVITSSAYIQYELAVRAKAYSDDIQRYAPQTIGDMGGDYDQGGHHLWWIAASLIDFVEQKRNQNTDAMPEWKKYEEIRVSHKSTMDEIWPKLEAAKKAHDARPKDAKRKAAYDKLVERYNEQKAALEEVLEKQPKLRVTTEPDVIWYTYLLDQVEKLALSGEGNAKIKQLIMESYARIMTKDDSDLWNQQRDRYGPKWPTILWWYAQQEPMRLDLIKYYFAHYVDPLPEMKDVNQIAKNINHVLVLSEPILKDRPNDPVALWYSGMALQYAEARRDEAYERMRKALEHRVDKHVRIFPETRAALTKTNEAGEAEIQNEAAGTN